MMIVDNDYYYYYYYYCDDDAWIMLLRDAPSKKQERYQSITQKIKNA
jgi:hypothetical protein